MQNSTSNLFCSPPWISEKGRFCVHPFPLREIWWNCFHVCSDLHVSLSSSGSLATRLALWPGGISVGGCTYMMSMTSRNCVGFTNKWRGGERQFIVCAWTGSLSKLKMNIKYVLQNCQKYKYFCQIKVLVAPKISSLGKSRLCNFSLWVWKQWILLIGRSF